MRSLDIDRTSTPTVRIAVGFKSSAAALGQASETLSKLPLEPSGIPEAVVGGIVYHSAERVNERKRRSQDTRAFG